MVELFFDIETKKLFDEIEDRSKVADLGVSIVSAYRREIDSHGNETKGEMRSFWERDFDSMWPWFEGADRIIGFNSVKFDAPVLDPLYHRDFMKLPHFDMLDKIKDVLGHRLSLDTLAKSMLEKTKSADGLMAVEWWNKGDPESLSKLKMYCEMDVEVTKGVYDYVMKNKKIKFVDKWNEAKEVEIDFSYPLKMEEVQMGLF
jgi:DEAD/DEAH box helicase domain-containing protein